MTDIIRFSRKETKYGEFGYVRIYSFDVNNHDAFLNTFIANVNKFQKEMEMKGLIIDVRGNGGGSITAAEKLLQVLSGDKEIERERFHFINTPLTLQLCKNVPILNKWKDSIDISIETGAVYSQGFPLIIDNNNNGQGYKGYKYKGPVILITDALTYSAAEIFAAGFKDNKIGKILGVHEHTGGGGANVWTYGLLKELLGEKPSYETNLSHISDKNSATQQLNVNSLQNTGNPHGNTSIGWDFTVSIRRATRIKEKSGIPLEDFGVEPDSNCIHKITKNDLLNHNKDLIEKAAGILEEVWSAKMESL